MPRGRPRAASSYDESSTSPRDTVAAAEAFQQYCVEHQQHIDENSIPTPTPDELHRVMAGEEVELAPSGIPLKRSQSAAEAINRSMLGDDTPPPEPPYSPGNLPAGPPE
jgi:hypothetical protein